MSLSALRSCASCAEQTDTNLCCARCHTLYCSRACQKTHWSSGHKKACKGIARACRDTDREAQSRALARIAHMSGGAPGDTRCMFCLDWGDAEDPILRGCACRGSAGWTHMGCLVKSAQAARVPPPPEARFAAWLFCSTCKQRFTGLVQLRLAIALWAKHARAVETNVERILAAASYAAALTAAGEHAEAVRLERGNLDAHARTFGPEDRNTLTCASNLAASLFQLGEYAEARVLVRTTLAAQIRTLGADHVGTILTENCLLGSLLRLGEHAEAKALGRRVLEKWRRTLGRDHNETITVSEAVEIQREVLVSTTRLLGAEHKNTLTVAANLAHSLALCGKKTEAEQLFRETLALSRRALGPNDELTQTVLRKLSSLCARSRCTMSDMEVGYEPWAVG